MNLSTRVSAPLLSMLLFPLAAQAVSITQADLPQTLRTDFWALL